MDEILPETTIEQISTFTKWIKSFLTWNNLLRVVIAVVVLLVLWIVYRLIIRGVKRVKSEKMTLNRQQMIMRAVKYAYWILVVMYVLSLFGVKLSAIWGAAGIAGVAIGFAAQTSVSNLISGLFVITEGSLKVGDFIVVDGVSGIVDEVKLISVRIHTLDNQMIRIPNSKIIDSSMTNNSYHSIRRMTLNVSIAYNTDMPKALEALEKAPALCDKVLTDPAPAVWFDGFGESGINMTIAYWFNSTDLVAAKNQMYCAMKKVFDDAGIDIPYNKLDVNLLK